MATGIRRRHGRKCRSRDGGNCDCGEGWQAEVYSRRDGKKIRKVFASQAEAKSWRADAVAALGKGTLKATSPITLAEAWAAWYAGAKEGTIRNRSGDPYKPSALRSYEQQMRRRVMPALGSVKLAEIQRVQLQELVDRLVASGLNPSTVQGTLLPIRAVFRRAMSRGEVALNPTTDLEVPAVRGRRERFASADEAEKLIAAVPFEDRAVWATALYGGLRHGELVALRAKDVDIAAGVIHVCHGWDAREGRIELKSNAGRRRVPIAAVLRDHLADHLARTGRYGEQLMFGKGDSIPINVKALQERADKAWKDEGLGRITPHECRHTFASLMIAAGVNAKALSSFMGHAGIQVTLDRYGHLMPGSHQEGADLLDAYLAAQRDLSEEAARAAGSGLTGTIPGTQLGEEVHEPHR